MGCGASTEQKEERRRSSEETERASKYSLAAQVDVASQQQRPHARYFGQPGLQRARFRGPGNSNNRQQQQRADDGDAVLCPGPNHNHIIPRRTRSDGVHQRRRQQPRHGSTQRGRNHRGDLHDTEEQPPERRVQRGHQPHGGPTRFSDSTRNLSKPWMSRCGMQKSLSV